jgi:transposase-like protein
MRVPELLSDPVYHDEDAARAFVESVRWPDGPHCPKCGVLDTVKPLGGESMGPGWYYCSACQDKFTARVGAVFERSHIPLHKWLLAFRLMASSKKGVSAHQLHRTLGVTYKTAWFMAHRIREAMRPNAAAAGGPLGGQNKVVEVDETYVGGKARNRKNHVPPKEAVISLVEREGRVRSRHVANVNGQTLKPILKAEIDKASYLMTDESTVYPPIAKGFGGHGAVNHSIEEYVRGRFWHTNTVESYFSILKRGVIGTYHHVSAEHLKRYLGEFDFRHNERAALGIEDAERTEKAIRGAAGKRLTYQQIGCGWNPEIPF